MTLLQSPILLNGNTVNLVPLDKIHFQQLIDLSKDKRIWEYYTIDGSDTQTLEDALNAALVERDKGTQYPFVIIRKADNKLIGSTRFLDIQFIHKKIEIGWTWIHPDYWATAVNLECKLLLLSYCFEILKLGRVFFKADATNQRSRKAIAKIGAEFEGILRNDVIRDNGIVRSSAYYSILDSEWEIKKLKLEELLTAKTGI